MARITIALLLLALGLAGLARAGNDRLESDKTALAAVKGFVGDWRGVGSVKASGGKDAWAEDAEWSWDFKGGKGALVFASPKGKYYTAGRLEPGEKAGQFRFAGTMPDGKTQETFSGEVNKDGELVLLNGAPKEGRPDRMTMGLVAKGMRMVIQYQRKERKDYYAPVAELGYTLKGSGFGKQGDMRECVVTGGTGKIPVTYKGQTYYVCCGGCKEAFDENPEKEMAAYRKRKEEEKKK